MLSIMVVAHNWYSSTMGAFTFPEVEERRVLMKISAESFCTMLPAGKTWIRTGSEVNMSLEVAAVAEGIIKVPVSRADKT